MKKLLYTIILALVIPSMAFASPVSVNRLNNDHIEPLNSNDFIKANYFTGTSTSVASTFPKLVASTNGIFGTGNGAITITNGSITTTGLGGLKFAAASGFIGYGSNTTANYNHEFFGTADFDSLVTLQGGINVLGSAVFNNGLTDYASTTIGDGTQIGGLTINGGATTTLNAYFGGTMKIADGTAASPSIQFSSDADSTGTGIYRSSANRVGFSANGTFIGQVLSTGFEIDSAMSYTFNNRGGLSTSADGLFRLASNGGANMTRLILGSNTSTGYGLCFGTNATLSLCDGTGAATSTKFGIGSTTPFGKLGIKGDGTSTGKSVVVSDSNNRIIFQMLDNGNVKIGSSTPSTNLFDVDGVISSGADGSFGGGEIRSYQIPGFYLSLKTDTTLNKSGLLRSNASGSKYIIDYNTSSGDTEINGAFSASGNIIFSNLDVETGRIRNGLWSIGASKFPASTLDVTQPAISTAKTASYDAIKASNTATSSTASVIMSGIETVVTGTNSGTSAKNIGVYVSSVSGGTANYDAIFNGGGNVGIATTTPPVSLSVGGLIQTKGYTVATLPTCTTAIRGSMGHVTDALAPTFLAALVGGGAVVAPAFCDGTNWVAE